jgi:hypothetical protein
MRVAANSSSKIMLQYLRYGLAAAEKHNFRQAAVELGTAMALDILLPATALFRRR